MVILILYFSGTGNSYYVAKQINTIIKDEMLSINQLLKNKEKKIIESDTPFIIVAPTYAWRIPRVVESFIRESSFKGNSKVYFVLTCAGDAGNAAAYAQKISSEKGLTFMGLTSVLMPDNYMALYDSSDRINPKEIIQNAVPHILDITKSIKSGNPFTKQTTTLIGKLNSSLVNAVFYKTIVSAKGFHSTQACISCKKCVKLCPLNNIEMDHNKPHWGSNCTHCMACIGGCPTKAIEYKKKTQGKPRYYNTEAPL